MPRHIESQADQFPAEFLMPETGIHHEIVQPATLKSISRLKPGWGVAVQALIRRAHEPTIITPGQYRYLNEQFSMLGWKTEEPKNLDIAIERPRGLRQIVELIYGIPIGYKKMVDEMALAPKFLEEIIEAPAGRGKTRPLPYPQ